MENLYFSEDEMRAHLIRRKGKKTLTAFAKELGPGVSSPWLSDVLKGRRNVANKIANRLGYESVRVYRRIPRKKTK